MNAEAESLGRPHDDPGAAYTSASPKRPSSPSSPKKFAAKGSRSDRPRPFRVVGPRRSTREERSGTKSAGIRRTGLAKERPTRGGRDHPRGTVSAEAGS